MRTGYDPEAIKDMLVDPDEAVRKAVAPRRNKAAPEVADRVVVVPTVGASGSYGDADAKKCVAEILGKALPLFGCSKVPSTTPARPSSRNFPRNSDIVDALLRDVVAERGIRLRPTVLVEKPGGGKSRLARQIMAHLEFRTRWSMAQR